MHAARDRNCECPAKLRDTARDLRVEAFPMGSRLASDEQQAITFPRFRRDRLFRLARLLRAGPNVELRWCALLFGSLIGRIRRRLHCHGSALRIPLRRRLPWWRVLVLPLRIEMQNRGRDPSHAREQAHESRGKPATRARIDGHEQALDLPHEALRFELLALQACALL